MSLPAVTETPQSISERTTTRPRCAYIARTGTPCRYSALPGTDHCKYHVPAQTDDALATDLLKAAGKLASPADVRRVMHKIFQAMVERRLTPKEAGVLCYIAQTILHAQRATLYQQKLEAEAEAAREEEEDRRSQPDKLTWNLPPLEYAGSNNR